MNLSELLRSPRVLLLLVAIGVLWPGAANAQNDTDTKAAADDAKVCQFTKAEAREANGGEPLGQAIWGRLCEVKDGKPAYAKGATVVVSRNGAEVGQDVSDEGGVFIVAVPEAGENITYEVRLIETTLPSGFSLTNKSAAVLPSVRVKFGDQQAIFRLGKDTRGVRTFSDYATTFAKGLRLGLTLAVAGVGLSLVFGVTGLVNFAHAELLTVGALITYSLTVLGLPFVLAALGGVLAGGVIGGLNDVGLWRPLRKRRMSLLSMMVVSIGLSTAVRNLLQIFYGVNGRRFSASSGQRENSYGPFRLTGNDLSIIIVTTVVLILVTVLLRKTRLGTAIRAVADNKDLAESSGIAVNRIISIVWVICGMLAALGGILYALTVNVRFDTGALLLLSMFAAVVLGGLGNAYGAIFGGVVIGVVQEMSGMFIDTAFKFVTALGVLIVVLLIRPQGILGQRERFG